jgi:hypothetical protein
MNCELVKVCERDKDWCPRYVSPPHPLATRKSAPRQQPRSPATCICSESDYPGTNTPSPCLRTSNTEGTILYLLSGDTWSEFLSNYRLSWQMSDVVIFWFMTPCYISSEWIATFQKNALPSHSEFKNTRYSSAIRMVQRSLIALLTTKLSLLRLL